MIRQIDLEGTIIVVGFHKIKHRFTKFIHMHNNIECLKNLLSSFVSNTSD